MRKKKGKRKIICRVLRNVAFSVVTRPVWIWDVTFSSFPQNQNHNLKRNDKSNIKYRSKNPIVKKQEIVKREEESEPSGPCEEKWPWGVGSSERKKGRERKSGWVWAERSERARKRSSGFSWTREDWLPGSDCLRIWTISSHTLWQTCFAAPPLYASLSNPSLLLYSLFSLSHTFSFMHRFPTQIIQKKRSQIPLENEIYQSNLTPQAGSESEQIKRVEGSTVLVHGTVEGGVIGWRRGPGKDQSRGDIQAEVC